MCLLESFISGPIHWEIKISLLSNLSLERTHIKSKSSLFHSGVASGHPPKPSKSFFSGFSPLLSIFSKTALTHFVGYYSPPWLTFVHARFVKRFSLGNSIGFIMYHIIFLYEVFRIMIARLINVCGLNFFNRIFY